MPTRRTTLGLVAGLPPGGRLDRRDPRPCCSPPLTISGQPDDAESLALVVDEPDAPSGTFVHWLLWNVPAETTSIQTGLPQTETLDQLGGARQGTNDFGEFGYRGPKPPDCDGPHTYRFRVHAVDTTLELDAGTKRQTLADALEGHVLATAELTGEYER